MRKKYILFALLLLFVMAAVTACKEREQAGPSIYVEPGALILNFNAGDQAEFSIDAHAGDNELRQVRITQKPEGGITTTLKDTTVFGDHAEFFYVYNVPSGAGRILLSFVAIDTDGRSITELRDIYVESAAYLTETTGYEMFSPFHFGSNNAFNFDTQSYLQLDTETDSTLVDLTELDTQDNGTLSHNITSLSKIKFVRNNSFNYAQATTASALNTYSSSVAQQLVTNIQVNDILITEYDTIQHRYAVIKFTGVFDDSDPLLDRYIFNVKK